MRRLPHTIKGRRKIQTHNRIPVRNRHALKKPVSPHPGAIDQDIEAAPLCSKIPKHLLNGLWVSQVSGKKQGLAATRLKPPQKRRPLCAILMDMQSDSQVIYGKTAAKRLA